MFKKLQETAKKSYSPYSNFKVAAILEEENDKVYAGANIENTAFPSSLCAERIAIGVAKMADANFNKIKNIHIFSPDYSGFLSPCGGCRQIFTEHLNLLTKIHMYSNDGNKIVMTLGELVPMPILPNSILGDK